MFFIFVCRDSSFQSVGKECLFVDFWVDICFGNILVVISLQWFFGKCFLFRILFGFFVFPSLFGRELLFWDFWCRFLCRDFLFAIPLQSFYWNNLWDHSRISSGRFVAGANETKSNIFYWKTSDISLTFANSYFRTMHVLKKMLWDLWFIFLGYVSSQKSFGFFLGCSQQDLLETICGRLLLRKATEICSRISLKNCLYCRYFR